MLLCFTENPTTLTPKACTNHTPWLLCCHHIINHFGLIILSVCMSSLPPPAGSKLFIWVLKKLTGHASLLNYWLEHLSGLYDIILTNHCETSVFDNLGNIEIRLLVLRDLALAYLHMLPHCSLRSFTQSWSQSIGSPPLSLATTPWLWVGTQLAWSTWNASCRVVTVLHRLFLSSNLLFCLELTVSGSCPYWMRMYGVNFQWQS